MGLASWLRQIGHMFPESEGGRGTVKIGSRLDDEIGGLESLDWVVASLGDEEDLVGFSAFSSGLAVDDGGGGIPETKGAGRSSASVAFRLSCREKSLACHHSRNLRANMEVGRRNRKDESSCGYSVCGLKKPKRFEPGRERAGVLGLPCVISAIARKSDGLRRLIRDPIIQRNGDEYLVLSNR